MSKQYKPKNKISLVEWFIKHQISSNICSVDLAIARALDSQITSRQQ